MKEKEKRVVRHAEIEQLITKSINEIMKTIYTSEKDMYIAVLTVLIRLLRFNECENFVNSLRPFCKKLDTLGHVPTGELEASLRELNKLDDQIKGIFDNVQKEFAAASGNRDV